MLKSATSRLSVARGFINPSLSLTSSTTTATSFSSLSPVPKHLGLSIRGVQVGGREIPDNKRVEYSLQYIHGIGRSRAHQILCDLNIENKITKDLSQQEIISLRDEVSSYLIDFQLICSVVVCEGADWVEWHETLSQGWGRMGAAGFESN
ncbi:hypothetical protein RHGRI_011378 [Rhododendron griersonianum]|uniref:Ribosomal protein S13 n=1 Tax=Rhododendron griersonianum TaxID=479676 RepID=A0AAV6KML6_9ERIC|nr:hypothetical protein RHGRI_011378 [Rhododendron griersonianum]